MSLSSQPNPPKAIIVHGDLHGPWQMVLESLAGPDFRISLAVEGERNAALPLAARMAARGAVVLPLSFAGAETLCQRIVEDFGRLDGWIEVLGQWNPSTAEALLTAASPFLRQSRPAGHFILALPQNLSAAHLDETAQWAESQTSVFRERKIRLRVETVPWSLDPPANIASILQKILG